MKMNRTHLTAALALGGLLALGATSFAQERPAGGGQQGQGRPRGQDRLQAISERLQLTDQQKEKLKPIFEEEGKKRRDLMENKDLSQAQRREKMQAIRKETSEKVKPILTAEQWEKWQKMMEQGGQRQRRGQQ